MVPVLLMVNWMQETDWLRLAERHLGGGNFEEFGGDRSLTDLVVFERQVLDELLGVVGRALHRNHPRRVLGGTRVEDHLIDLKIDMVWKHGGEHLVYVRLEEILGRI